MTNRGWVLKPDSPVIGAVDCGVIGAPVNEAAEKFSRVVEPGMSKMFFSREGRVIVHSPVVAGFLDMSVGNVRVF